MAASEQPGNQCCLRRLQVWLPVMSWYVDQKRQLEETVKKYSDPPSEHLLPDLPLHARCLYQTTAPSPATKRVHGSHRDASNITINLHILKQCMHR